MQMELAHVVSALGGELHGEPGITITALAPLDRAGPGALSFLSHAKYRAQLSTSLASCVIVSPQDSVLAKERGACIVTPNPYLYFARVTQLWRRHLLRTSGPSNGPLIHPTAVIAASAQVHPSAAIGALCVVEAGAQVGADSVLKSRVTVGENCVIGQRCLLHPGVVIGADGFGFALDGERWEKIEQLGSVWIGNDVEIGANTCIDRGALQDTVIEDGVKLDNLIQIGHNVRIGRHTALAGCVGVAGSTTIGANCTVGGGAVVLGHLTLAPGVHISASTVVTKSVLRPGNYTGVFPMEENSAWERNAATLKQLHSLRDRIKTLEKEAKR
jgi:UDP-3-O-[3-hydroxymyristoyl] glucosamine N-acyltransferase